MTTTPPAQAPGQWAPAQYAAFAALMWVYIQGGSWIPMVAAMSSTDPDIRLLSLGALVVVPAMTLVLLVLLVLAWSVLGVGRRRSASPAVWALRLGGPTLALYLVVCTLWALPTLQG